MKPKVAYWAREAANLFSWTDYGLMAQGRLIARYQAEHVRGLDGDELAIYDRFVQAVLDEIERRGLMEAAEADTTPIATFSYPWEKPVGPGVTRIPARKVSPDDPLIKLNDWEAGGGSGSSAESWGKTQGKARKVPKKWVADQDEEQLGIYRRERKEP